MMRLLRRFRTGSGWGLVMLLFCLMRADAWGQVSFEHVYAAPNGSGTRGVSMDLGCGTAGGFISVGSRPGNGTNADVYVVRTKGDGSVIWAQSYDIGAIGWNDYATSIVELNSSNGYAITGITQDSGSHDTFASFDIFVMQIDCDGNVVWVKTFGDSAHAERAQDIKTAPALLGDGTEDLVIAGGRSTAGGGVRDALLFRLSSTGAPIWERTYDLGVGKSEGFTALTVTTVTGAGDIVAVGSREVLVPGLGSRSQGFMMRVGPNGLIGGGSQGAADFGPDSSNEIFQSVIELKVGPLAGNLVAIGETNVSPSGDRDIYVVRTGYSPCSPSVQRRIGNHVDSYGLIDDSGYDIKELAGDMTNYNGMRGGYLILTGYSGQRITTPTPNHPTPYHHNNLALLGLDPTTLIPVRGPVSGTGRLFGGDSLNYGSYGYSLAEVDNLSGSGMRRGIIICGLSTDDLTQRLAGGEFYIVKTDDAGRTGCEFNWFPPDTPILMFHCLTPIPAALDLGVDVRYELWGADNDTDVCPRPIFPKLTPGFGTDDEAPVIGSSITSAPNPIERGQVSTLSYTAATEGKIVLTVADEVGKIVNHSSLDAMRGRNAIAFDTHDLPAGVYMITIANGDDVQRTRVVIVSRR
ncbi:MAG: hypothetical protein JWQ98_3321 [Chlorobi bacterium]|nr:hypothetical protein [Chlorobiota bacterium]